MRGQRAHPLQSYRFIGLDSWRSASWRLSRTLAGVPVLLTLALAPDPALASDNTEGLDACLSAVLALHDGIVLQWEVEDGTGRGFAIQLVAKDGGVWEMTCQPTTAQVDAIRRSMGTKDYATLNARARVPEARARSSVLTYYPGRFIEMQYGLTWRGGALYSYTVITPDDREAQVDVDAATGRIVRTRSEARF